ncbi:MAG: DUF6491 family protein [Pseudomonadota bacterium]
MLVHRITFAAMVFIVSACATAPTPEQEAARAEAKAEQVFANDPRRGEQVDRLCFTRSIDGFTQTTRRAVILREGNDQYLIETFPGCFDLDWAQSIGVSSHSACLRRGDLLISSDSPFSLRGTTRGIDSCRVKAIYEWDREDAPEAGDDAKEDETQPPQETGEPVETALIE